MTICKDFTPSKILDKNKSESLDFVKYQLNDSNSVPSKIELITETYVLDHLQSSKNITGQTLSSTWYHWRQGNVDIHKHVVFSAPLRPLLTQLPSFFTHVPMNYIESIKCELISKITKAKPEIKIQESEGIILQTNAGSKVSYEAGLFGARRHRIADKYTNVNSLPRLNSEPVYKTEGATGFFGTKGFTGDWPNIYAGHIGHDITKNKPWYLAVLIDNLAVPFYGKNHDEILTRSVAIIFGIKIWDFPVNISETITKEDVANIVKGHYSDKKRTIEPFFDLVIKQN